jgi:chorismate dehydratase
MIRLGRVDYINTFPLAWSLARHLEVVEASEVVGVPTALNAMLHAGEVDVANVSSVEYGRHHASYVLLPSLCVGSDGAVESVQLVTDVPLDRVRSIAATSQSASSVVLARILLPNAEIRAQDRPADARLLIGDEALRSAFEDPTPHHDLGVLWRERTGLPMVFAVWAARRGTPGLDALDRALAGAVADARDHSADVAAAASARYGYPAGYLARYFEKLRYRFGDRERAGLQRFFALAHEAGLIDDVPDLRFAAELETVT